MNQAVAWEMGRRAERGIGERLVRGTEPRRLGSWVGGLSLALTGYLVRGTELGPERGKLIEDRAGQQVKKHRFIAMLEVMDERPRKARMTERR